MSFTVILCKFRYDLPDEKKASLPEIASERSITQRATGWKIHHVAAQLDELVRLMNETPVPGNKPDIPS